MQKRSLYLSSMGLLLAATLTGCTQNSVDNLSADATRIIEREVGMNSNVVSSAKTCGSMMMNHLNRGDGNYDENFINTMIPHHQQAIAMAKDALTDVQQPEIKQLAQQMIDSHEKEVKKLQALKQQIGGNQSQ